MTLLMLALKRFEVEFVDKVRVVVYIAEFVEVIIDVLVGSQKVSSRKPDRDVLAQAEVGRYIDPGASRSASVIPPVL
jgi:hypothetical protein